MRRLPIFLMLDVSESMVGDNLRQLQQGLDQLVSKLRTDPHALETVHLSTIVFAGKPRTLTQLTELVFYSPPRLPVGSGTSLGLAMMHLMSEIDLHVVKSTLDKKGDWKPIVYLMTDGKPTDEVGEALDKWEKHFANRVTLVAIGIGKHVSLTSLRKFTEHVFQLDAQSEDDFKSFVDWISMSVSAQSRSVSTTETGVVSLAKFDDSIMKKIDALVEMTVIDEDFAVLTGKCSTNKLPYLIKYERIPSQVKVESYSLKMDHFSLSSVYPLEKDYYELSDNRSSSQMINSEFLLGNPGCPHCGNSIGFAMCSCGQIMCIKGAGPANCPSCQKVGNFDFCEGDGFDVNRSRG